MLHFLRPKNKLEEGGRDAAAVQRDAGEPEKTCPSCRRKAPVSHLLAEQMVCSCGHHFRMKARQRIHMLTDSDSFLEMFADVEGTDPLGFPGYEEKLEAVMSASGEREAVICGTARVRELPVCVFAMEPYFMMGSMGTAVGEKVAALFEYAAGNRLPVIGYIVSGGARMQEGLLSLMQMAGTSAAVRRHSDAGLLYIAVLTNPTTGGVTASFGMEADIILAEPGAVVGFAGARVVEQTTRRPLPADFQKAETVMKHGFIDSVVPRNRQRSYIAALLKMHNRR